MTSTFIRDSDASSDSRMKLGEKSCLRSRWLPCVPGSLCQS